MKLLDHDPELQRDMAKALREARQLLSICDGEAEAKDIISTLLRIDGLLIRADAQHI